MRAFGPSACHMVISPTRQAFPDFWQGVNSSHAVGAFPNLGVAQALGRMPGASPSVNSSARRVVSFWVGRVFRVPLVK